MAGWDGDAELLFLDFTAAIVRADGEIEEREKISLAKFESVLFRRGNLLISVNAQVILIRHYLPLDVNSNL
jgi:hypothetical protein